MSVRAVAVVVPARDEQDSIGACLASVRRARRLLWVQRRVRSSLVVVADHCRDATGSVASGLGADVVICAGEPGGGVGAARAEGCAHALHAAQVVQVHDLRAVWLACTDADSLVPVDWLTAQVATADRGADVVAGRVALPPHAMSHTHLRWRRQYEVDADRLWRGRAGRRGHVHGANLGVRADAYLALGGFAPRPAHEDVDLVARALAAGRPVAWPARPVVVTAARLVGRAPAGLAGDLCALG